MKTNTKKHLGKSNSKSHLRKTRKDRKIHTIPTKKQVVTKLLQMLITVKLYHWNTMTYSVHKATDELYGELNTLMDQFVEVLLGKHDNVSETNKHNILNINTLHVKNYKDNGLFKKSVEDFKTYLVGLNAVFSRNENSDLMNIRDEILAVLNKVSYLLTLK